MLLLSSCHYYKIERILNDGSWVESGIKQDKYIILHFENFAWHLMAPQLNTSTYVLTGKLGDVGPKHAFYKRPATKQMKGIKYNVEQGYPTEELHIYVNELAVDSLQNVSLQLDAIKRIDIYSDDKRATRASYSLAAVGMVSLSLFLSIFFLVLIFAGF